MVTRDLLKSDLNLLISLQVMLEEKNVSRAAERLFITQPAMSKTLTRLRELFNDPLFTRSSHGMRPTPRAEELARDLPRVLEEIRDLLSGESFDPAHFHGEISVALAEHTAIWLLPRLMGRLQLLAPHLAVRSITRVEQQLQQLAEGHLDFVLHIKHAHYGSEFICHPLGGSSPVILAREAHPLTGIEPSWDDIRRYPLLRLYIADLDQLEIFRERGTIGQRLGEGARAAGGLETSHLLTAIEVLRNSDYLMPAPPFLLGNPTAAYKIQALNLPDQGNFKVDYVLVRHRRTEHSAMHNWLWEQMIDVLRELEEFVRGR